MACWKNHGCGGHEATGYVILDILSKSKGDEFVVSEISVFVFGFVVTLAIVFTAEVVLRVNRGK